MKLNIDGVKQALGLKGNSFFLFFQNIHPKPELVYLPIPEISDKNLTDCVNRLWEHQAMFKPYTQNLKLFIGHDYGVNPESGLVSIRWDFLVDPRY